jgi:peptidoglycan L-alanyl-D-glutamate endopeptidase CwlK
MYKYSKISKQRWSTLHPDLQLSCQCLLHKFDHSILAGYRNIFDQNTAYEKGYSTKKFPNSKHNQQPSIAVDIAPYPRDSNEESDKQRFVWMAAKLDDIVEELLHLGLISHRLRWGRNWDGDSDFSDQTLYDFGHFELIRI